jgi:hypothetical protein
MTGYEEMNGTFPIESTMGEVERLKIELERETEVALAAVKSCQEGDELIDSLQSQLAASQERERILREGLESIRDGSGLPVYCAVCTMKRADEVEP